MALFVLCDSAYRYGVWCDTKLRGIMDEAARRRIRPKVFTKISEAKNAIEKCGEDAAVILLFDALSWLKEAIAELSQSGVHMILSANYISHPLPVVYSLVGTDSDSAMKETVDYLRACKKQKIALVGVNRNSCNDSGRAKMFKKYVSKEDGRIFYIEDNMLDSFDEFLKVQEFFDAAICTNDLVAIPLIEHLKNYERKKDKLFVISHTDTIMARLYSDGITSVTTNFYDCGRLLVETYYNRIKYGLVSSQNLLPATLKVRGSTDNIAYEGSFNFNPDCTFFSETFKDVIVPNSEIGRLERMLVTSDLVNFKLMYCLICGYNYEKMSEYCFISPETARYRVRKIKNAIGVQKKSSAAEFIRTYIKKEKLLSVISEFEEKNNKIIF